MAQRLFRISVLVMLTIALLGPSPSQAGDQDKLRSTIAFTSTRDTPTAASATGLRSAAEIYLMNPDGTDPRRLTTNTDGDGFAVLSPDGKWIVFDRTTSGDLNNGSDLFLMKADGNDQTFLTRGSSASWSPDSKSIAFHASASGTGTPLRNNPGSATTDSDIFVVKVGECLEDHDACQDPTGPIKRNLTNTGGATIEDDVDWSPVPDGNKIVFTSHDPDDYVLADDRSAEIDVINADGTGLAQLADYNQDVRGPEWSPNGEHIAFLCRSELLEGAGPGFEICVVNADGTGRAQLTHDNKLDTPLASRVLNGTPSWSPDGEQIAFSKNVVGQAFTYQLWSMNKDGTDQTQLTDPLHLCIPRNCPSGINLYANWGEVRITGQGEGHGATGDAGPGKDGIADHGQQDKDNKAKQHKHDKHNKDKQHKGGGKRHR